jgi:hypothetical protein
MSMIAAEPGLLDALSQEMTPKFLATRSASGEPNLVPCTSIMPARDAEDRLIFGNFLLRKSVDNLDADPRVSILVITTDLEGWVLQGDFQSWQRAGDYVDRINSSDLLRYNAYTGIRNAGIIEITKVVRRFRISKPRVLADYLLARASRVLAGAGGTTAMPLPVRKRFSPMTAVRAMAFLDDEGYPLVAPVLSLQPAGESALTCALGPLAGLMKTLAPGVAVAASLLTLDVVSFQAKGRWLGEHRTLGARMGTMSVTAVYAGGPPIPGRQVA